jgi:hypothetical protein
VEKNYQVSVNEFAFVIDPSHDQGQVPIQFSSFRLTDVHVLRTKIKRVDLITIPIQFEF